MKSPIFLLTIFLFVISCNKKDLSTLDSSDKNYYPVKNGYWIKYAVDSIRISFNNPKIDSFVSKYQILETIDSFDIDLAGNQRWKLTILRRADSSKPWDFVKLWTLFIRDNKVHKIENNIDFIKMVFPIGKTYTWYDKAYYDTELEKRNSSKILYEYNDIHMPYQGMYNSFDSTIRVVYYNYEDVINKDHFEEIYAKNIGMVYSEEFQQEKNPLDEWTKPQEGFYIRYQYLDHAK